MFLGFESGTALQAAIDVYDFVLQHRNDVTTLTRWGIAVSWLVRSMLHAGDPGARDLFQRLQSMLGSSEHPGHAAIVRETERLFSPGGSS